MNKVMVAGATGFVGSHVLDALRESGVETVALVRDRRRLPGDYTGEVREGDMRDTGFLAQALEDVDVLCLCAAWTSAWGHAEDSRRHYLEPTLAFLETAVAQGVRRIVYPSSTSAPVLRDRMARGRRGAQDIWPHLANLNRIEDHMQTLAGPDCAMVALRLGLFAGERYGLGMLPILLPRLRSHLVPWVGRGRTALPLVAGPDVGRAMAQAACCDALHGYTAVDVVGPEIPTVREVFHFLHEAYGYPVPHFGVSFGQAYAFARLMEALSRLTPWDPFITRSVILLLEETAAGNQAAQTLFGYQPRIHWKDAIRLQLAAMQRDGVRGLPMARALPVPLAGAQRRA